MAAPFSFPLLPAIWLFTAYDGKHGVCVSLENGLNLGYEAIVDLSKPYLRPIAMAKFPVGTTLVGDETQEIFVTSTTIYGLAMGPSSEADYRFA